MKHSLLVLFLFSIAGALTLVAQTERRDKAVFTESKNEFIDSVQKSLDAFYKKDVPAAKTLRPDFSLIDAPKSVSEFKQFWHNPPISQGLSGMCWCFSTTSFLESEIYRQTKREIKLSELYTVYWEYVEKTKGYVRSRGNQSLGEGSQGEAVLRAWKKYGIVPADAYTGLLNGQPFHDHTKMFREIQTYLTSLKSSNAWDEETAVKTVRSIMDQYIGTPPEKVTVGGKAMTPKEYCEKIVKLNLDDYLPLVSFCDRPYDTFVEYDVPDNWWHGKEYYNVPLDQFMSAVKTSVRNGYSIAIWGDTSEPGLEGHAGIAVVPSFDIPSQYIDENARIFRYKNGTTGDDHGIHIVGYTEKNGKDWYLIKDSGSGARNNSHAGYYFYSEDYVKLKMLGVLIHKSAIPEIMGTMKK
ncbi:MAG: C1 family peptidase [Bacteroidota bacterium]